MNPLPHLRPPNAEIRPDLKAFRVLGIDLGTTNSTIAQVRWSPTRPDEIELAECLEIIQPTLSGDFTSVLVPSVVAHLPDRSFVGEGARRTMSRSVELGLRPNATYLAEVKNEMGIGRTFPQAKSGSRTPAEISGQVLQFLRAQAKGAIARTVVTVPASFQISQRRQGLAALDGVNDKTEVMIIDFGGGTCDVAIFTLQRTADQRLKISPRAVSRYHRLGGADIDRAIVHDILIPALAHQNKMALDEWEYEVRKEQLEPQLLATAEQLKIGLCEIINHRLSHGENLVEILPTAKKQYPGIQTLQLNDGTCLAFNSPTLNGIEFANVMEPFLDEDSVQVREDEYTLSCSIFAPIEDALDRAKLKPSQIGFLLAVGGSSLNPLVIDSLKRYFGEFLVHRFDNALDMQVAVARGAAYHALLLHLYGQSIFTPVASDLLSLQTDRGNHEIIPHNQKLPFSGQFKPNKNHRFIAPGGPIRIVFWAGLGMGSRPVFTGVTPPIKAGTPLTLTFTLDANQHFTFEITPEKGGESFSGTIESPLHNVVNPGKDRELILEIERNIRASVYGPDRLPVQIIELANLHNKVGMNDKAIHLLKRLIRQRPDYKKTGLAQLLADAFRRFGKDLSRLDDSAFSWYGAAVELAQDTVIKNGYVLEERRRNDLRPGHPAIGEGQLPMFESHNDERERP
ncbi:MAG: hypothetical protein EBS64_03610 [Verrucomicrobia bacterium]|nr:hypothetical protein [Verrucomicrobiota bacterium]